MNRTLRGMGLFQNAKGTHLIAFDAEMEGDKIFLIHQYWLGEKQEIKERILLASSQVQWPSSGTGKFPTANGEYDFFYKSLLPIPKESDN